MRHLRIWAGILALTVVAALVPAVASATPDDECEAAYRGEYDAAKLKSYLDCRLDRLERGLTPSPAPTVTVTAPAPTVTVTATPAPAPTVTITASPSASPTPSDTPTPSPSVTVSPTVTPSAAAALLGWQIDATNVGLAGVGLDCDSLPLYTGSLTPAAGTRISGVRIEGSLDLRAGDITVDRSCIRPTTGTGSLVTNYVCGADDCPVISDKTIIIRDSEFDASKVPAVQIAGACAFRGVGTLQRNYMHGMGSGICFYGTGMKHDAIAEQNYVTDMRSSGESHNEAATLRDLMRDQNPDRVAIFRNNRFRIMDGNVTAGLFIQPTWDDIDHVLVEGNLIEGGGFNLYLNRAHGTYSNTSAINNRFNPVNAWGPVAVDPGPEFDVWRDNYIYDPDAADAKGRTVNQ